MEATNKNDRPWGGQALPAPTQAPQIAQAPAQQFMPPPQPVAQAFAPTPVADPFGQSTAAGAPSNAFAGPTTEPPKRGRGPAKPKAETPISDGIPPFLQRAGTPPAPNTDTPAFGMDPNPQAPDAGVQAALDAAFRLPT